MGGDNRDHGLGNTWRACGHVPGGNGSEETPRGQPDEASAANRWKGQAHGVGVHKVVSSSVFKEKQRHESMS